MNEVINPDNDLQFVEDKTCKLNTCPPLCFLDHCPTIYYSSHPLSSLILHPYLFSIVLWVVSCGFCFYIGTTYGNQNEKYNITSY